MSGWTTSNPIEIAIFASCYAFARDYYKQGFAGIMKRSNLFVVCGYSEKAPAGNSTDTNIVNSFFSYTNSGNGVVSAWKKGNNYVGTFSWGAVSYGTTEANMNFKMPGWGSNAGIDRKQKIWYVNQSKASVITPLSRMTTPVSITALPTEVSFRTSPPRAKAIGSMRSQREMRFVATTDADLLNMLQHAELGEDDSLKSLPDALSLFQPMYVSDITDTEVGIAQLVGGDLIYQNVYRGVPIEGNFVRLCADSDGIYDSIYRWYDVDAVDERCSDTGADPLTTERILSIIGTDVTATIEDSSLCYLQVSPGCLHLCQQVYLSDGQGYIVDVNDRCLR